MSELPIVEPHAEPRCGSTCAGHTVPGAREAVILFDEFFGSRSYMYHHIPEGIVYTARWAMANEILDWLGTTPASHLAEELRNLMEVIGSDAARHFGIS